MKLNLKNVVHTFKRGVKIDHGMPAAVASLTLMVLDTGPTGTRTREWSNVGTITRDDYLNLTAKQLKSKIMGIKDVAGNLENYEDYMIQAQCTGGMYSRSIDLS